MCDNMLIINFHMNESFYLFSNFYIFVGFDPKLAIGFQYSPQQ